MKNYVEVICEELKKYSSMFVVEEMDKFANEICKADQIFVAGAGRSGFAARGFVNRLLHLGLCVSFVGEPSTPAIKEGDVLVIGSGSGTTASLVVMAQKAIAVGAKVITLTIFPEQTIGSLSKVTIRVPGATPKKEENARDSVVTVQPMGSLFEQYSWITYDAIVLLLMEKLHQSAEQMIARHTNLE